MPPSSPVQPINNQYYDATKREQTRSIVIRFTSVFSALLLPLTAHNGLVAGSSPADHSGKWLWQSVPRRDSSDDLGRQYLHSDPAPVIPNIYANSTSQISTQNSLKSASHCSMNSSKFCWATMAADLPLRVFARSNNAMGCVGSLRPFDSGSSIVVSRSGGFRTSQFPTQISPL